MERSQNPIEPAREKRFSWSYVDKQGRTLEGVFFFRRPALRDLLRIEAEKQRLVEGQALDPEFVVLASLMARLKVVLREVPAWLKWDEVEDLAIVTKLAEEVDRIEAAWFPGGDPDRGGAEPGAPAAP